MGKQALRGERCDIVAGGTDLMFGNQPELMGQIRDGGLRAGASISAPNDRRRLFSAH